MKIVDLPELKTLDPNWVKCLELAANDSVKHGFADDILITWKPTDDLIHLDNPVRTFIGEYLDHQSYVEWLGWTGETFHGLLPVDATTIHTSIRGGIPVGEMIAVGDLRDYRSTGERFAIDGIDHLIRLERGARNINGTMVGVKVSAYRVTPVEPKTVRKYLRSDGGVEVLDHA